MIRLGVVGYGNRISNVVRKRFRGVEPDLRVVGVVDPDRSGVLERLDECDRADVTFHKTLDDLVRRAKPDALVIGTRCSTHARYACQAAKYDLPLFLEKPVATSMRQATALERAFQKTKCEVVVSFPLRVSPLCQAAHRLIENDAVGRPDHILGVNYVNYGIVYWQGKCRDYTVTQGLFLQKATHDFDYMSFLMGSPIVRVAAMATCGKVFGGKMRAGLVCSECAKAADCPESPENRARNRSTHLLNDHLCLFGRDVGTPEGGMNEDSSSALLEFASGAHGAYTQVFYSRRDAATRGAVVSGYHGTVSFDWYKNELRHVRHHAPLTDVCKTDEGLGHFGGDTELAYDFIRLIRRTGASRTPIETGIRSAYACLAAKESARTGRFVKVRQVGG